MSSTIEGDSFQVLPELTVVFGEGSARRDAFLTRITHPLEEFECRGALPSALGTSRFSIGFGRLPLVRGFCRVEMLAADRLRATEIDLDSPLDKRQLYSRLGPFTAPADRSRYQEQAAPGEASQKHREPGRGSLYQLVSLIGEINSQEGDVLLCKIIDAATQIMNAQAASLMITDETTGELVVTVPTGPARAEVTGIRIPSGQGIAGWVAKHGEPVAVSDVAGDPRFFGEISGGAFVTTDLVAVPLHTPDGRVIGVLEALNKNGPGRFVADDIPLLLVLADHAALALEKERLTKAAIDQQILARELTLAAQIQEGYWPRTVPSLEGFEMAGMSVAARQVGGDYYDFIILDDDRVAVVVADVSGKGVAASLVMSAARSSLRANLRQSSSIAKSIALVNTAIAEDTPPNRFITLFLAVLDRRSRVVQYVNAGHNAPFLLNPGGGHSRLEEGGPIVGFRAGLPFSIGTAEMPPGATLVLFSDGVSEAQGKDEEFYGEERLLEASLRCQHLPASELLSALNTEVQRHMIDAPQYDDLTLVVVKASPEESTYNFPVPSSS